MGQLLTSAGAVPSAQQAVSSAQQAVSSALQAVPSALQAGTRSGEGIIAANEAISAPDLVPLQAVHAAWGPRLLLIVAMLGAAWVGLLPLVRVPAVVPADAPAAVFSGGRAMQDLAVVAAQPHPIGSPANGAVRDYLLAEIAKLGLEGQVQRTTVNEISPLAGIAQVTPVENVLVRLPGTRGGGKAVLISGHYDSVATTPGAGDCGSCTAAVLETLRAAAAARDAGQGLQNDVIFLFTDGEELGVVGATAFMREHPWARDVGLSIVLEGLGTQGSSLLYASGPQHGSVVLEALGAMAEPGGYAYLNDVMWKLAGNSGSDLDAFVADGRPGLAFVHLALDGVPAYHSGGDNVQALDPGTLQQHGDQALSLVRHFGNVELDKLATDPDAVYFSLLPGIVVGYARALALPLAVTAGLLALVAVVYGWRRRAFGLWGLLGGTLVVPIGLLVVLAAATGVWWLLRLLNPNWHMYAVGGLYGLTWTTAGLVLLALAILGGLQWGWRVRMSAAALAAGGLLWWAGLALLLAQPLGGFGYVFALPLVPAALAAAWLWSGAAAVRRPWLQAVVLAVPACVAILLITPVVYGLAVFGARMEALTGLPLAAFPLPFVALAGVLLAQQADFLAPVRRWALPATLAVLAVLCLGVGYARSGFDQAHPKLNTVVYQLDGDTQSARWITVDDSRFGRGTGAQLDEWTRQFFAEGAAPALFNPWASGWFDTEYPALAAPAPVINVPQSQVSVVSDEGTSDGGRLLRLQIAPAEDVQDLYIQLASEGGVRILGLNGEEMAGEAAADVQLNVNGHPREPVTVDLRIEQGALLKVNVQDRRLGLPAAELGIAPRPDWMAAAPFNDVSDSTIVVHTDTIE